MTSGLSVLDAGLDSGIRKEDGHAPPVHAADGSAPVFFLAEALLLMQQGRVTKIGYLLDRIEEFKLDNAAVAIDDGPLEGEFTGALEQGGKVILGPGLP
jgi:hypothetical protein